ncbi:MAG: two-component regulator propeller domain-containing protein [Planctomycetota bacterium]
MRLILCLLISLTCALARSQTGERGPCLDPDKSLYHHKHRVWTVKDGLPQMAVTALCQDHLGFLWVGTQQGLARFDGQEFVTFGPWNSPEIGGGDVAAIAEDEAGNLWVASNSAGLSMRRPNGSWQAFSSGDGLPHKRTTCLDVHPTLGLLVGTIRGLARRRNDRFEVISALGMTDIQDLAHDAQGKLWIATSSGFISFQDDHVQMVPTQNPRIGARSIDIDASGRVWMAGPGAIGFSKDGEYHRLETLSLPAGFEPTCVLATDPNQVLLGSFRNGLIRLLNHPISGWRLERETKLFPTAIKAMIRGRENTLWIGAVGAGLHALRESKAHTLTARDGLSDTMVWAVAQKRDGALLIGTEDGGLNIYRDGQVQTVGIKQGLPAIDVLSILEDRKGRIWLGSAAGGVSIWDGERLLKLPKALRGLSQGAVYNILEDQRGRIWLGGSMGLCHFDGDVLTQVGADVFPGTVWNLTFARDGGLLACDRNGGVFRIDAKDEVELIGLPPSMQHTMPSAAIPWKQGQLIGNFGGELIYVSSNQVSSFRIQINKLPCAIMGILRDTEDDEVVWLNASRGIVRLRPQDLFDSGKDHGEVSKFGGSVIDYSNGLRSLDLNGAGGQSIVRLRDGRIAIPGSSGLEIISGKEIHRNTAAPLVIVNQVTYLTEEYHEFVPSSGEAIRIPRNASITRFDYTATSLVYPDSVRFRYKLEGYDEDWIDADSRRSAFYTGIPAGEFRFRVLAANEDGVWNEAGTAVNIVVPLAFYESLFFRILMATLVVLLAYVVLLNYLRSRQVRLRSLEASHPSHEIELRADEISAVEADLLRTRDELEARVKRRTSQLDSAHESLQEDIKQRRRLERQLQRARKLESVGRLAGGIAHDLNNMLTAVLGYADLIRAELKAGTTAADDVNQLIAAGHRATKLTEQLLTFAQRRKPNRSNFDVNELVLELDGVLRQLIGADIEFVVIPANRPRPVLADPSQLEQVLINLVVNAGDAQPRGGKIVVEILSRKIGEESATGHYEIMPGDFVEIRVTDQGTGMPPEVLERLFEPFFTTKESSHGSGLGLSICYGIVKQNRGFIEVNSEVGHGTSISVYIPLGKKLDRQTADRRTAPSVRGSELIVLAEDESLVRKITARGLRALGYEVVETSHGEEALRKLEELKDKCRLVLTDVVMPIMNGMELSREVSALHPSIPVIFMSGYAGDLAAKDEFPELGAAFIQKPFTPNALACVVRRVLDAAAQD